MSAATTATASFRDRAVAMAPTYGAAVALVVLVLANVAFTPNFAAMSNLWTILLEVSTTVLVAIGMTLVIGTGGIDLSVGSVMAVASVVATTSIGRGAGAAVLTALAASAAVGVLNGVLVTKAKIQPFVVTLATLIAGRGIAQVVSHDGELIPFENASFEYLGKGYVGPAPFQVVAMVLAVAAAWFLMRSTSFARYVMAVGGNERAARLAGVRVDAARLTVYVASAVLAGFAGVIVTARLGTTDPANVGNGIELDAIAAVVVGGTPLSGGRVTVLGTLVGALIMEVITTSFNMHLVPYPWSLVVKATIILFAVFVQRPKVA